jgi:hypothetical protein
MDMRRDLGLLYGAVAAGLLLTGCPSGPPPKFSQVQSDVFAKSCVFSTCHKGASPAGGLALDGNPYDRLVGAKSTSLPERIRVIAGDPDQSYVLEKLTKAKPEAGAQMPPGAPLTGEQIDIVRRWIEAGALND